MRKDEEDSRARKIASVAKKSGASLVGFADLSKLRGFFDVTDDLIRDRPYGVCVAVGLERWGTYNSTTEDDLAFPLLERIARAIEREIKRNGFSARVVKPDKRVAHNSPLYWRGEISHKAAAKIAGLGWIGKSTLLVTPELGPRVCLITVLTDMPLPVGSPMKNRCGRCRLCVTACPLGVLKGPSFDDYPGKVEQALDVKTCGRYVNRTWADGQLCYRCMLACPRGKKKATT
jgi:epoxyqueuosine reductase